MLLCAQCTAKGFCQKLCTPILTDSELSNPEFIRGIRMTANACNIQPATWLDFATDKNRDYRGWMIDLAIGLEAFVDMEPLEEAPYEWWRDFCCRVCQANVTPHVRPEAWERVRSLGSILRAAYPMDALLWGLRPANLNRPPRRG